MLKFLLLFLLVFSYSESKDYCEIFELKPNQKYKNCLDKQKVFAYLYYLHNKPNLEYEFNQTYDLQIPIEFKSLILNFLEDNCYLNGNNVRIKEITNFEGNRNYRTKIVISCNYRS